jgi:hypothetical protein
LLNNQCLKEQIGEEIKRFLEFNENEKITYQNLWGTTKTVLRGKFIAMNAYIKRTDRSQMNDLMLHLSFLEKQEQAKHKTSRIEIIKIGAKIIEIETTKTIQRINETKRCFFENINKIDKPPANLTKMRRKKTQVNKIRNEKEEIKRNTKEIQGVIRDYFENLYTN